MSLGERGMQGDIGHVGPKGEKGSPGVAPWVVREALKAYLILVIGVVLAFSYTFKSRTEALNKIEQRRIEQCEAGNERSRLQLEDYRISLQQARDSRIERILGLSKEQADELRRITVENAERRISQVPFVDCKTGKRLPPPTP